MQNIQSQKHSLILEERNILRISGVKDIDSFSENRVVLSTIMGELVIRGEDFHVNALETDTGDFSMTGKIKSMCYNRFRSSESTFGKLFR